MSLPARLPPAAVALSVLPAFLAGGCAAGSSGTAPDPVSRLPALFDRSAAGDTLRSGSWWSAFGDPALDGVVAAVIEANHSLAEAAARVEQARSRARLANAARLPVVAARAGLDAWDLPTNAAIGAQLDELGLDFPLPERLGLETWTAGLDFAWEADLRGPAGRESLAAGSEWMAAESDVEAVRIGILAETIAAWFEIRALRRQHERALGRVEIAAERERAARDRYQRGLAGALELSAMRQARRRAEAAAPGISRRLVEAESRLAVLAGGTLEDVAGFLAAEAVSPPPPTPVPTGIPADQLLQRPDVRAARHRLDAAGHAVGARRAALRPRLSLSGSIGLRSTEVEGLFDVQQWFATLASGLLAPVFDGGRLRDEVAMAEARFEELAAAYGRAVVTAAGEVEAALAALEREREVRRAVAARREHAAASLDLERERYAAGVGGYDAVLGARDALLAAESDFVGAERRVSLARLAIHRALGGGWDGGGLDPSPAGAAAR